MIRATYMGNRWIGIEIDSLFYDYANINTFVDEGTPILIIDSLEEAENLGIEIEQV